MTAPSTALPDVRRNQLVPWAVTGLVGAALMVVAIVLLAALIRKSDVSQIQASDEPLPVAA